MTAERFVAGQKYVLPEELAAKFDDIVELMLSAGDHAFYDLVREFDVLFGEYECPKS